jgi:hypothetical protein
MFLPKNSDEKSVADFEKFVIYFKNIYIRFIL